MSVSDKLNEIAKIRRSQAIAERVEFIEQVDSVKAARLFSCGSWLMFREFIETGESRVINAALCKLPFLCEICAVRRAAKLFAASIPKVQSMLRKHPELHPVMITFGLKTGPDLAEQFDRFAKARNAMSAACRKVKSAKCHHNKPLEFSKVKAQIRSIELKRAAGDATHWNVHCHIFALLSDWIDHAKFSEEWKRFTGDSFIVDLRSIYEKGGEETDPVGSALAEVIKYPLKFADLLPCDAWEAHDTLKGRRMTDLLGLFRGILPGDISEDLPLADESGPYRDFVARWLFDQQKFCIEPVERKLVITRPNRKI
jgi:hypothetical protein